MTQRQGNTKMRFNSGAGANRLQTVFPPHPSPLVRGTSGQQAWLSRGRRWAWLCSRGHWRLFTPWTVAGLRDKRPVDMTNEQPVGFSHAGWNVWVRILGWGEEAGSAEGPSQVDVIAQGPPGPSQWHSLSNLLIQHTPETVHKSPPVERSLPRAGEEFTDFSPPRDKLHGCHPRRKPLLKMMFAY